MERAALMRVLAMRPKKKATLALNGAAATAHQQVKQPKEAHWTSFTHSCKNNTNKKKKKNEMIKTKGRSSLEKGRRKSEGRKEKVQGSDGVVVVEDEREGGMAM